jgi:hypothetical protein
MNRRDLLKTLTLAPFALPAIAEAVANPAPLSTGYVYAPYIPKIKWVTRAMMILICGRPNVGKTTLARAVFSDWKHGRFVLDIDGRSRDGHWVVRHANPPMVWDRLDRDDLVPFIERLLVAEPVKELIVVSPARTVELAYGGIYTSMPTLVEMADWVFLVQGKGVEKLSPLGAGDRWFRQLRLWNDCTPEYKAWFYQEYLDFKKQLRDGRRYWDCLTLKDRHGDQPPRFRMFDDGNILS